MEVDSKVSVSEPEIGERYRQHIAEYTEPAKIRLREIVVKFDAATEVDQGQKARRLLQEIKQGADFAEVARMHSESTSREAGGDLGFFEKGDLTDALANAAFALAPGEVSDVIRMPIGFLHPPGRREDRREGEDARGGAKRSCRRHLPGEDERAAREVHPDASRAGDRRGQALRVDVFLKSSRLVKRRTLAKELCDEGAVLVNGRPSRAGRELAPGDEVTLNLRSRVLSVAVAELPPEYKVIKDEKRERDEND